MMPAVMMGAEVAHLPAALLGHRCSTGFGALGSRACRHGVLPAHCVSQSLNAIASQHTWCRTGIGEDVAGHTGCTLQYQMYS